MRTGSNDNSDPFAKAMAALTRFETSGITQTWKFDGFHVWPIVKYVLVKQIIFAMQGSVDSSDKFKAYLGFSQRRQSLGGLPALGADWALRSGLRAQFSDALLRRHHYWLFGAGSGMVDVNGQRVSQHHHAIRAALRAAGHESLGLYSNFVEGAAGSGGAQVSLDPLIKHIGRYARGPSIAQAFMRRNCAELDIVIAATAQPEASLFAYADTLIARVACTIKFFAPLFQAAPPRAVFSGNYASFYGWAMAHLCRGYGARFVDIQHGLQGRSNGSYFFHDTPAEDWSVLPSAQLSWTATDADLFTSQHPSRQAAVVGPTWGQMKPFLPALPDNVQATLHQRRARKGPLLLFAAQQPNDVLLAKALHSAGANLLFKPHPTRVKETERLIDPDTSAALGSALAATTPLPFLLDWVDGVVTGYSATILEAALLGIPSFATQSFAQQIAKDYQHEVHGLLTIHASEDIADQTAAILAWAGQMPAVRRQTHQTPIPMTDALAQLGIET
jgi:hypothetical protein